MAKMFGSELNFFDAFQVYIIGRSRILRSWWSRSCRD